MRSLEVLGGSLLVFDHRFVFGLLCEAWFGRDMAWLTGMGRQYMGREGKVGGERRWDRHGIGMGWDGKGWNAK